MRPLRCAPGEVSPPGESPPSALSDRYTTTGASDQSLSLWQDCNWEATPPRVAPWISARPGLTGAGRTLADRRLQHRVQQLGRGQRVHHVRLEAADVVE